MNHAIVGRALSPPLVSQPTGRTGVVLVDRDCYRKERAKVTVHFEGDMYKVFANVAYNVGPPSFKWFINPINYT